MPRSHPNARKRTIKKMEGHIPDDSASKSNQSAGNPQKNEEQLLAEIRELQSGKLPKNRRGGPLL